MTNYFPSCFSIESVERIFQVAIFPESLKVCDQLLKLSIMTVHAIYENLVDNIASNTFLIIRGEHVEARVNNSTSIESVNKWTRAVNTIFHLTDQTYVRRLTNSIEKRVYDVDEERFQSVYL